MSENELNVIPDLPKGGPLGHYRSLASFNWKKLKIFFEGADLIKFKVTKCTFNESFKMRLSNLIN